MSDFAPRDNFDFAQAIIGFVKAQAGAIGPHRIRTNFASAVLSGSAETRAEFSPRTEARLPVGGAPVAADRLHSEVTR